MKKIILTLAFAAFGAAIGYSQAPTPVIVQNNGVVVEINTTEYDFGTIPFKSDGTYDFVFESKGNEPFILNNVYSSCGCTVLKWPKQAIYKGEEVKITVTYDTKIVGDFSKTILVYTNADDAPVVLAIKGSVAEEEKTKP